MSSLIIGGKSKEHDRVDSDFYPTPAECTIALINFLDDTYGDWLPEFGIVHEPACGDGAISEVLKSRGLHVYSSDLRHTGYGFGGINYLTAAPIPDAAIITNPPFNLAEEFIWKARKESDVVAMLLKGSYWHAAGRLKLFNAFTPSYILPLTWRPAFVKSRGNSPLMEMMWTVWFKGDTVTKYRPLLKPKKQPTLF